MIDSNKQIMADGSYFKRNFIGDTAYTIEWGNSFFKNESKKIYDVLGNGTAWMLDAGDSAIILNQGCGQSCEFCIILPLKKGALEQLYENTIAADVKNNLIVLAPIGGHPFVKIENYLTHKTINIYEKNLCSAVSKQECIDSCYFENDNFIIKWDGSKASEPNADIHTRRISIKSIK